MQNLPPPQEDDPFSKFMREQNGKGGEGASAGSDGKGTSSSSKKSGSASDTSATAGAAKATPDKKEEKMVSDGCYGRDSLRNCFVFLFLLSR